MKTIQAYRFALDLTPCQERHVLGRAGAARVAHNWALARVKAVMDQRTAERTYGIPEADLTPAITARVPAARWGSPSSRPGGVPLCRCGSPPARSASSRTGSMWRCPGWAG